MNAPTGNSQSRLETAPSRSQQSLEFPDSNITVDDEFAAIWATAEVIGALSSDDYRWSFTSVLLALLYSEQDISRWFLGYAQAANIHLSEICRKRGFAPQELPLMREEFDRGGAFLKKSAFTSSVLHVFQGAADLCKSAGTQPQSFMGARHLLGAFIYRLPSGHLDELRQWGFVPSHWSENFVQFVSSRMPQESLWAALHEQHFRGSAPVSQASDAPQVQALLFQVIAPEGPAEFPVSGGVHHILSFADLHKKSDRLTSEALLFAAVEVGRTDSSDATLRFLSNSVIASTGAQYQGIASTYFDPLRRSATPNSQPIQCTSNVTSILREAQRVASLVAPAAPNSPQPIDFRHLVAALLTTSTMVTTVLASLGVEIETLKTQLLTSLSQTSELNDNLNFWGNLLADTAAKPPQEVVTADFVPLRADFTADTIPSDPSANDRLGFKRDVRAFASVIASRDLTPPMSIGIFGDWGSGKSFFMRQLEQKIVSLAGKDAAYCSHVLPVWFNAWHYVDQNLWATLVTEIFDKLFAYIRADKHEDAATRLKTIEEELSKQQGLHTEAKADLANAEAERNGAESELKKLRQTRQEKENSLSVQLNDVARLVAGNQEVVAKLHDVERDLGLPALQSSYETFETQVKQMQSLGNRTIAVLTGAFREPGWIRRIGSLLVVFGLPALIVLVVGKYVSPVLRMPSQAIAGGVAFLASATLWMRSVYIAGSAVVRKAETTFAQLKAIRELRVTQQEAGNIGEIEVLREREAAARQKLTDAESKIQELRRESEELQPGRRLQRFIEERSTAGDYREHLGLVSLIRRDFETLSRLLRERQDLPVDRIVLFIDDLDRCPPDRVCEVLEAIHLILAFELFVVVVGVDVRWISRALQKRYSGLLTAGHSAGPDREDLASPDDYLEKIFQIPFWINPLFAMSSRELVSGMLAKYPTSTPTGLTEGQEIKPPKGAVSDNITIDFNSSLVPAVAPQQVQTRVPETRGQDSVRPKTPEPSLSVPTGPPLSDDEKSAPIALTEGERNYILELSEFGGSSPRRLKRFINLYRIIKSTISESEMRDFLGQTGEQADYKLALVLLAVLTGSPSISSEVLRKFQQPGATLPSVLEELSKHGGAEHHLSIGALTRFQNEHQIVPASAALNRWSSIVARYNFRPWLPMAAVEKPKRKTN